jgi:hypothetical protein
MTEPSHLPGSLRVTPPLEAAGCVVCRKRLACRLRETMGTFIQK